MSTSGGAFTTTPIATAAGLRRSPSPTSPPPTTTTTQRPRRSRGTSLTDSILNARPPPGILAATGEACGRAPTLEDLRRNSGNSATRRGSQQGRKASMAASLGEGIVEERRMLDVEEEKRRLALSGSGEGVGGVEIVAGDSGGRHIDDNDQLKEKKPNWWAVTKTGLLAFWRWFLTPMGFLITIYMLNVVAWGGMLFLLLINASPAMCHPSCNDINSPRRIWIEIDSQILNALFCVTGFGLIPWRFRDLWYLLKWRCGGRRDALERLAGIHEAWFRLEPRMDVEKTEQEEETMTAPATKTWKLDYVIWLYCWNTFFQCCLSGFMWGMDRYERPAWSTGLFVALACLVAGFAGGMVWWETRKVKRVEGEGEEKERGE